MMIEVNVLSEHVSAVKVLPGVNRADTQTDKNQIAPQVLLDLLNNPFASVYGQYL